MAIKIGLFPIMAGLLGALLFSQSLRPAFMPDLGGAVGWLNSSPLNAKSLRGKVVLINFWTYTCINSLRPMPYVKAWAAKYKDAGLVVIGVHTPEFSFERCFRHSLLSSRPHVILMKGFVIDFLRALNCRGRKFALMWCSLKHLRQPYQQ